MVNLEQVLRGTEAGKFRTQMLVPGTTAGFSIPVLIIRGEEHGPSSLINGATHGDEFDGPEAIGRFWRSTAPESIHGQIVLMPALNLPAYLSGSRNNPDDPVDMSRAWSSDAPSGITRAIAQAVEAQVLPHVSTRLDLHGGGDIFNIARLAMFTAPNNAGLEEAHLSLAQALGIELIWRFPNSSGEDSIFVRNAITSIGVEIGGEARLSELAVQDSLRAVTNYLIATGNLHGHAIMPRRWLIIEGRPDHSTRGGYLSSHVALGERVRAGQRLGVIRDVIGDVVEDLHAPFDGIVTTIRTRPNLPPGGATFQVSRVIDEIPNSDPNGRHVQ